jgi:hypothetical protein
MILKLISLHESRVELKPCFALYRGLLRGRYGAFHAIGTTLMALADACGDAKSGSSAA